MLRGPHRGALRRAGSARVPSDDGRCRDRDGLSATARTAFGSLVVVGGPGRLLGVLARAAGDLVGDRVLDGRPALSPPGSCPTGALKGADWAEALGEVVRLRRFWVLVVVSISINVCWHFLINWLPTYLKEDRGMTYLASGMLSAVPFLAADVGQPGRRGRSRGSWPAGG